MRDGRKVRVEDLMFPGLVKLVGEVLAKDEAGTTPTLHPLLPMMMHKQVGAAITFATLARTATLFLVDHQEFAEAVTSAGESPPEVGLPPLPYPRVAVECLEDATWQMLDQDGGHGYDLELFFINERQRGRQWDVVLLTREAATQEDIDERRVNANLVIYGIEPDNSVTAMTNMDVTAAEIAEALESPEKSAELNSRLLPPMVYPADHPLARAWRKIPVEFAHIVNARGVTVEPVDVPRAQRRRFQRNKLVHPQLYFVKIGGELVESYPGHGNREYHCRWLVRGHWRHLTSGERTWVRPYIKGPAGAPWRGRPVYVVEPSEG